MSQQYQHGNMLYRILPAVYRERDQGDLQKYLDACGLLLDQIHQTLLQRHADCFPDVPDDANTLSSQEWLLPYFAKLLDAKLISPTISGKRKEINNAISWRKAKGTGKTAEEIAEAIGNTEIVIHEGWQRLAVTPRLNRNLVPVYTFGYQGVIQHDVPGSINRHPELPAATVDFRLNNIASLSDKDNPAAEHSTIYGQLIHWRQTGYHGVPCAPGMFDDTSRRTMDLRTPDWCKGHYHPRRVILFRPVAKGFFEEIPP